MLTQTDRDALNTEIREQQAAVRYYENLISIAEQLRTTPRSAIVKALKDHKSKVEKAEKELADDAVNSLDDMIRDAEKAQNNATTSLTGHLGSSTPGGSSSGGTSTPSGGSGSGSSVFDNHVSWPTFTSSQLGSSSSDGGSGSGGGSSGGTTSLGGSGSGSCSGSSCLGTSGTVSLPSSLSGSSLGGSTTIPTGKKEECPCYTDLLNIIIERLQSIWASLDTMNRDTSSGKSGKGEEPKSNTVWGKVTEGISQQFERVVTKQPELSQIGGSMKSAGSVMGSVAEMVGLGPVGVALEGVMKFGGALMEGVDKLKAWANGLQEANMRFAQFSAAMSQVAARAEMREFQLGMERGNNRAGTAEGLAQAQNRLDKATAPLEDLWGNSMNALGGVILDVVTGVFEATGITATTKLLNKWLFNQEDKNDDPQTGPFLQLIETIMRDNRRFPRR